MPGLHHVEIWVADRSSLDTSWAWLLNELGFELRSRWGEGASWSAGGSYLTITTSPTMTSARHDRRSAGMNHVAFRGGSRQAVDALMRAAAEKGWRPLYAERYPHAGGVAHYAGWLEDAAGFKVEVVADPVQVPEGG